MKDNIHDKIRKRRLVNGLTQQNMADELNITLAAYSKIERGITEISINRLIKLSEILNVAIFELLEEEYPMRVEEKKAEYGSGITMEILRISNSVNELRSEVNTLKQEIDKLKNK